MVDPAEVALATDLYQLTMGASYAALGMDRLATFSLFVRDLPPERAFLVVAGLEEAIARLAALRFDRAALGHVAALPSVRRDFVERLAALRFTGEVRAVPEGRVVFRGEPLLEVRAPILEAQLAETLLLNAVHFPTTVASKAARCVAAAPRMALFDFGLRRAPGLEGGLAAARAAYLAGFTGTSNVLAGIRYAIPVMGTVAHSFVEAFPTEIEAFRAFARTFPGPVTLLIDTYDTLRGARHAVTVARELAASGVRLAAVRIDSGDLAAQSRAVREVLDAAGLGEVRIIVSGGLDEYGLAALAAAGAPIDACGVGSRVATPADAPILDMVYKIVEYDGTPRLKLSPGKATLAGAKQVWRRRDAAGRLAGDRIATRDEPPPGPGWEPLLETVVTDGEPGPQPTLTESRERSRAEVAALPEALRGLDARAAYPVELSPALLERHRRTVAEVRAREGLPG